MSVQYNNYIQEHIMNVEKSLVMLKDITLATSFSSPAKKEMQREAFNKATCNVARHDESKYGREEYKAYDEYFYGPKTILTDFEFNKAWLHHIHYNPHHWQHWILIHDDEPMEALDMPEEYIIEMICDWWSFSFKTNDLTIIFKWYDQHKKGMIMSDHTKERVEYYLDIIKNYTGGLNDAK